MGESLVEKLKRYADDGYVPMHMPGHKRNASYDHLADLGVQLDITEIDSFDDLNCPCGIFAKSERLAASLWGSDECVFSVNGSSGAILAAVRGAAHGGGNVVMSRACHKSVYHAIELCGLMPIYVMQKLTGFGFASSVDPDEIKHILEHETDVSLVIVTSPTYEGVISDIARIAEVCHAYGVPLMVDEAHGAHLGLYGVFPAGAVQGGADIVVQSVHKTLPSLTQTAVMHLSGSLIDREEIRRQMGIFQTSSPSYLLSASIDGVVRYLSSKDGEESLKRWHREVLVLRENISSLCGISLFCKTDDVFDYDVSKLVLTGGVELAKHLRECKNVELEMVSRDYVIAMTGMGDTGGSLERFREAITVASESFVLKGTPKHDVSIHLPYMARRPSDAVLCKSVICPIGEAEGAVSAGYIYAYPPGIPLIVPGEVFDGKTLELIGQYISSGVSLRGISGYSVRLLDVKNGK